jgi:predicted dehydrogenase
MDTRGVGIWGAGWVAGGHLAAYLAQPDCRVVAIGSRRLARAPAAAAWPTTRSRA